MWINTVLNSAEINISIPSIPVRSAGMASPCMMVIIFVLFCAGAPAAGETGRQLVTSADIEPVYRHTVLDRSPWDGESLEISDVRTYPARIQVPSGHLDYEVTRVSNSRFLGNVGMEIAVKVNDIPVRSVRVCGRVEVYRDVVCAAGDIRRGDIIRSSLLTTARMPVSRLSNKVFDRPESLVGMAMKHSVNAGRIITGNMVISPVVIRRGAKVTILAQAPCITVRVPGRAVEQGAAGDFIRVRNLQSRKEIVARVRDNRTVTVIF